MTHTSDRRIKIVGLGVLVGGLALQVAATAAPPQVAASSSDQLSATQSAAVAAGFQIAPKGSADRPAKGGLKQPNPYLAQVPDLTKVDYATWRTRLARAGAARALSAAHASAQASANAATPAAAAPVVWDEQEPEGTAGSNDTLATAERIGLFGTVSTKNNAVRVTGERAELPGGSTSTLPRVAEDNGSIPLAGVSGIESLATKTTTGVLGDGPHGPSGDDSNDFDFVAVDVAVGLSLVADTSASADSTDTVLGVYDADGNLVATDDDSGAGLTSTLTYTPQTSGTYYVMVAGYAFSGPLPVDPFDSGSGGGGAATGSYELSLSVRQVDTDNYAVYLKSGDVLGAIGKDAGASALTVTRPDGTEAVGADQLDASSLFPPESPLPGGGTTTLAYVAQEGGWYVVTPGSGVGTYSFQLEAYRPGAQTDRLKKQTVFLDFEGGRVNTAIWGGPGVSDLSPFSAFLGKWGIPRSRENAMIQAITSQVRHNIRGEVKRNGLNPGLEVRVANSRNHPELAGRENVSRVIVAGTIDESGIPTIGVAQFIDPGNYEHEDSALVLLDVLSDTGGDDASLNTYLTGASDREAFVAGAVGNVASHEIGHLVGSYHTDNTSDVINVMDSGGANFQNLFGVGPDGVGGTADDLNVRFTSDDYTPAEGFTGLEDTLNNTAWAYPTIS